MRSISLICYSLKVTHRYWTPSKVLQMYDTGTAHTYFFFSNLANKKNYCLSTRTIWAILQSDWSPRRFLSENITCSQCHATLARQVTLKIEVQSPQLVPKFPFNLACMLSNYSFLPCCSNTDVQTRLNVHVTKQ